MSQHLRGQRRKNHPKPTTTLVEEAPPMKTPEPIAHEAGSDATPSAEATAAPTSSHAAVSGMVAAAAALAPELNASRLDAVEAELAAWKGRPAGRFVRLDDAGSGALALVAVARRPEVLARLQDVESARWDCGCIDRLERFARTGVALQASARELVRGDDPRLMVEAGERKERLLGLLGHHFKKDPAMVAAAKSLDPGTTRLGMSKALYRLHELLAPHEAFLSHDRSAYVAEDFERAVPLADALADDQVRTLLHPRAGFRTLLRTALVAEHERLRLAIAFATFDLDEVETPEPLEAHVRRRRARRKKKGKAKAGAKKPAAAAIDGGADAGTGSTTTGTRGAGPSAKEDSEASAGDTSAPPSGRPDPDDARDTSIVPTEDDAPEVAAG
jgi:hypothetical protein